ncbi:MAG: EFR1 family ferrodoxin [Clostridiales bacterium]|nr:EFR1 family ferrodoxin [Clostridiales bacterium]
MAAKFLYEAMQEAGCAGHIYAVSQGSGGFPHDLLLLLFPLHACNAPAAVYQWIKSLPAVENIPAAVISVSGGGEVSPNSAGRVSSIKRLEKKGYRVTFEGSLVMPSNCLVGTKEPLAVKLLKVLPAKARRMARDILLGEEHRSRPLLIDRLFSKLGELEKPCARLFGRRMKVSEECAGCGRCGAHCPAGNISFVEGKPQFGKRCNMCLGCLYGCPRRALKPRLGKFMLLTEGYDLSRFEEKLTMSEPVDVDGLAKGFLWSGVRKYLKE